MAEQYLQKCFTVKVLSAAHTYHSRSQGYALGMLSMASIT